MAYFTPALNQPLSELYRKIGRNYTYYVESPTEEFLKFLQKHRIEYRVEKHVFNKPEIIAIPNYSPGLYCGTIGFHHYFQY